MEYTTSLNVSKRFNIIAIEHKQVAQLWQRERAKLVTFSINVQCYSQNNKIAFSGDPMGASWAIKASYLKVFT